jgi:hypothetical protein
VGKSSFQVEKDALHARDGDDVVGWDEMKRLYQMLFSFQMPPSSVLILSDDLLSMCARLPRMWLKPLS